MVTIKDFNDIILDGKIVVTYRDPNDIILCHNFDTPKKLEDRRVIRIISTAWFNPNAKVINVLVSI